MFSFLIVLPDICCLCEGTCAACLISRCMLSLQGGQAKVLDAAEQLRLSMFSFAPEQTNSEESGRGRGRSRGRGRGRGRR